MTKKILCLFDYGPDCFTGYATVSRNIVRELNKEFGSRLKIDIVASNYFGEPYNEYDKMVRVTSGKQDGDTDEFGRNVFLQALRDGDYDGIYIISDLSTVTWLIPLLRHMKVYLKENNRKGFRSMIYFPIDGKIIPKTKNVFYDKQELKTIPKHLRHLYENKEYVSHLDELDFFDEVVTYTHYASYEMCKIRPSLKNRLKVIYHGINTNDFYPLPENDKINFRKQYFGKNAHKFIIGLVNRNQQRKDFPTAIFGFLEAKKNWNKDLPVPFLYIHTDPEDAKGWNLRYLFDLIPEMTEGKDYMFSKGNNTGQVDIQTLNKIYNSLDVYLTTSLGEGWGLTITECFACKIPVIAPDHTSMAELTGRGDRALILDEFLPVCSPTDNTIRHMCHFEQVGEMVIAAALGRYYSKTVGYSVGKLEEQQERIDDAYKWVTQFTWENICKDWVVLFKNTFNIK